MSPFEVQITESYANNSGITLLITTTTVTQVHALHISYIAWISTGLNFVFGNFTVEPSNPVGDITHTPATSIGRNYARIFGLTGFIINNNFQNISLGTVWTGSNFIFNFGQSRSSLQYFSYQYLFFIGS